MTDEPQKRFKKPTKIGNNRHITKDTARGKSTGRGLDRSAKRAPSRAKTSNSKVEKASKETKRHFDKMDFRTNLNLKIIKRDIMNRYERKRSKK